MSSKASYLIQANADVINDCIDLRGAIMPASRNRGAMKKPRSFISTPFKSVFPESLALKQNLFNPRMRQKKIKRDRNNNQEANKQTT